MGLKSLSHLTGIDSEAEICLEDGVQIVVLAAPAGRLPNPVHQSHSPLQHHHLHPVLSVPAFLPPALSH